jgi:DNA-binding response OmpR family regulator
MSSFGSIILIVDDAGLLDRVTDALEGMGYDVIFAESDEAAMDFLKRGRFEATVRVSEFTFNDSGAFLL